MKATTHDRNVVYPITVITRGGKHTKVTIRTSMHCITWTKVQKCVTHLNETIKGSKLPKTNNITRVVPLNRRLY